MENPKVFISVGGTANSQQEDFVKLIEDRLKSEDLIPSTVGRNNFSADSPLKAVKELMNDCSGILIIALERTFFERGVEKRGGPQQINLNETRFATPWNQIIAWSFPDGESLLYGKYFGSAPNFLLFLRMSFSNYKLNDFVKPR
ncbi:MAG: hypothetical protein JWR61_4985 [Ferruginibacter sp.]|uniref:hypothetical protein n=1 Tax=Ferruginibacter sp. TaxID=1940288 RepID=UPI002658B376|nr:hypothetical protein [Ferruginibacter sp.]MDB5280030.1 hypothetical protein [Ferruginibacter sp.]